MEDPSTITAHRILERFDFDAKRAAGAVRQALQHWEAAYNEEPAESTKRKIEIYREILEVIEN